MKIAQYTDLQPYNTLAVPAHAEYFVEINRLEHVQDALQWAKAKGCLLRIIGGGSNIIFQPQVGGLTLRMQLLGREIISRSPHTVILSVGAGENWHELVVWCLEQGFFGLENLALIPGTVGAAPVQNIGAYGVEVAQFIRRVKGINLNTGELFVLTANECLFAYRDSVFKSEAGRHLLITHVEFALPLEQRLNITYPALATELSLVGKATAQNVFKAVCRIRSAKLPDPAVIPNCGSFFKNPVVNKTVFEDFLARFPTIPNYAPGILEANVGESHFRKIAAAWLIDQAGWRGVTRGGVSVHKAQALVLTNSQRCGAPAVLALAREIQDSVLDKFAIALEMEPQILGD